MTYWYVQLKQAEDANLLNVQPLTNTDLLKDVETRNIIWCLECALRYKLVF